MPTIILIHVLTGIFSTIFGGYVFFKKTNEKNALILAIGLTSVACTGLLIRTTGAFSPLHLFSIITLISVVMYAQSRGTLLLRLRYIIPPYIGLIIAFSFTFLPARRLGMMVNEITNTNYVATILFIILLISALVISGMLIKKYYSEILTIIIRPLSKKFFGKVDLTRQ